MSKLSGKKQFLNWLIQTIPLKQREAYWILNYLLNHEIILTKTQFVERADVTPRGLYIADVHSTNNGLTLYKDELIFEDPEQIFHEIRMNWRQPLYLAIDFVDSEKALLYQSILETNPYYDESGTDSLFYERLDADFNNEQYRYQLDWLSLKIDEALETGNRALFEKYSYQYNELKNLSN